MWVVLLAALHSYTRVPTYAATADVLVRPTLVSPLDTNQIDEISMETESKLVTSASVADAAKKLMPTSLDGPDLLKRVAVVVPESTQILEISSSDPSPAVARAGAQAFANAYLEFKSNQAIHTLTQHVGTPRERISEYESPITDLNRRLAITPQGSPEWKTLTDSRSALETSRLALQNELVAISTVNVDPGQVIKPPERPTAPSSPKHQLDLAMGVFLGVFAGIGLAAAERLRDRVRAPTDLDRAIQAPVLGAIPRSFALRGRSAGLVTVEDPRGPAAETFRRLRTNLLAICRQQKAKTLLVSSANDGRGQVDRRGQPRDRARAVRSVGRADLCGPPLPEDGWCASKAK